MICAKCNADNPDDKKFCGECGKALTPASAPVAVEGDPGAFYCARHLKEVTRVRCGRCETPICPRCTVHGAAGVRCKACAKNRVPIRAGGVLHAAGRTLTDNSRGVGQRVWYLAIWYFLVSLFFGNHHDS